MKEHNKIYQKVGLSGGRMFTQEQATALREKIIKEVPGLDVQIKPEERPYNLYYYLVISQKSPFVVRSEEQWQERKHLVIADR